MIYHNVNHIFYVGINAHGTVDGYLDHISTAHIVELIRRRAVRRPSIRRLSVCPYFFQIE